MDLVKQFREQRDEIIQSAGKPWEKVCVTMGLAVYEPENDRVVIDVARRADKFMYENKRLRKVQCRDHSGCETEITPT